MECVTVLQSNSSFDLYVDICINVDSEYYLSAAKTFDVLSVIFAGANVVLSIIAFFLKKKKYYFYLAIPALLEGLLSYIYSEMGGRFYDAKNDEYFWWNPAMDGFNFMISSYVVFFILLFVKIMDVSGER